MAIYLDHNMDRICDWADIPEDQQKEAAQSLMDTGKFICVVHGVFCKLAKQEDSFLRSILGRDSVAPDEREIETETPMTNHDLVETDTGKEGCFKLGSSAQMTMFRDLVKRGYTRAAWVADAMDLKAYQVSRLAKRAIRSGWLIKQGMSYAMRFSTGRPKKL